MCRCARCTFYEAGVSATARQFFGLRRQTLLLSNLPILAEPTEFMCRRRRRRRRRRRKELVGVITGYCIGGTKKCEILKSVSLGNVFSIMLTATTGLQRVANNVSLFFILYYYSLLFFIIYLLFFAFYYFIYYIFYYLNVSLF